MHLLRFIELQIICIVIERGRKVYKNNTNFNKLLRSWYIVIYAKTKIIFATNDITYVT
jgi:hypothetical protein